MAVQGRERQQQGSAAQDASQAVGASQQALPEVSAKAFIVTDIAVTSFGKGEDVLPLRGNTQEYSAPPAACCSALPAQHQESPSCHHGDCTSCSSGLASCPSGCQAPLCSLHYGATPPAARRPAGWLTEARPHPRHSAQGQLSIRRCQQADQPD